MAFLAKLLSTIAWLGLLLPTLSLIPYVCVSGTILSNEIDGMRLSAIAVSTLIPALLPKEQDLEQYAYYTVSPLVVVSS